MQALEAQLQNAVDETPLTCAEKQCLLSSIVAAVRAATTGLEGEVRDLRDRLTVYALGAAATHELRGVSARVSDLRCAAAPAEHGRGWDRDERGREGGRAERERVRAMDIGRRAAGSFRGFELLTERERETLRRAGLPTTRATWEQFWEDAVRRCD